MIDETSAQFAVVVDDDDIFRNRLCRALEVRGWKVAGAPDGAAALRLANASKLDLAVVDLRLPEMNGLDIVRELRNLDESTCIIVLTGYGSIATALTATKLGASYYISKPADADDILSVYEKITTGELEVEESSSKEVPSLARVEWEHIQRILSDCQGNISQAAKLLGLHRRSLQRKLSKHPPRL